MPPPETAQGAAMPSKSAGQIRAQHGTGAAGKKKTPLHNKGSMAQAAAAPVARRTLPTQPMEARIANALRLVAELLEHDEIYLPVFLRLEAELQQARERRAALERAKSLRMHRH